MNQLYIVECKIIIHILHRKVNPKSAHQNRYKTDIERIRNSADSLSVKDLIFLLQSNSFYISFMIFFVAILLLDDFIATNFLDYLIIMTTSKEPVRLRRRRMPSGNVSLYLDIYINGRRSYEYLSLYLVPENNRKDKEQNKQTLALAEAVRAKRLVEVRNGKFGFDNADKGDARLLDYFRNMCDQRKESAGNWGNWHSTLLLLEEFCDRETTFGDITPKWIQGFKDFLSARGLAQNTLVSYFNKLCACLKMAHEDGIIQCDPLRGVERFKEEETEKTYLTIEEVRSLAATDCRYDGLKRAFLFSCLTGLRKSDILKMRWTEVRQQGDFTRIVFKQKKTGGQEYIDITPEAVQYMGERGADDALVFPDFKYSSYTMVALRTWAMDAGITKPITFHTGRHTFAVLMLDLGVDIYTVQKLLGHKMIQTTMVYANIMDKKKQEAVQLIPKL